MKISLRNHGHQKEVAPYFSSAERKELSTTNSYLEKKYPSGMKGKSRCSQMKENEENLLTVNKWMVKWKMFKQKETDKTKNSGVSGRKNKKW